MHRMPTRVLLLVQAICAGMLHDDIVVYLSVCVWVDCLDCCVAKMADKSMLDQLVRAKLLLKTHCQHISNYCTRLRGRFMRILHRLA